MHSQTGVRKLRLSFAVNGPGTSLTQEDSNENQVWAERIAQCYSYSALLRCCVLGSILSTTHTYTTHTHTQWGEKKVRLRNCPGVKFRAWMLSSGRQCCCSKGRKGQVGNRAGESTQPGQKCRSGVRVSRVQGGCIQDKGTLQPDLVKQTRPTDFRTDQGGWKGLPTTQLPNFQSVYKGCYCVCLWKIKSHSPIHLNQPLW